MAQMGRPRQVTDQQLLEAMPGSAQQIAARVGLKTSGVWGRLRQLEASLVAVRDRERVPHIWHPVTIVTDPAITAAIGQAWASEDRPFIPRTHND